MGTLDKRISYILFSRSGKSDKWHWCRNCPDFPTSEKIQIESFSKIPENGSVCKECLNLMRKSKCKQTISKLKR